MPLFLYTLRDPSGNTRTGSLEAPNASAAAQSLRANGSLLLDLQPSSSTPSTHSTPSAPTTAPTPSAPPSSTPITLPHPLHPAWLLPIASLDLEIGIQQLASMLRSGLPILDALETVALQARRPRAARLWLDIRDRIQRGQSMSAVINHHSHIFPSYLIQLIRVGEHSGEIDLALSRCAQHLASQRDTRTLVTNALLYPILTILMAIGVSIYLILGVIPKISDFLQSSGETLPPTTQSLLDASAWLQTHGLPLLALILFLITALLLLRRHPASRLLLDSLALRIPPFGNILRLSATAIFSRGLGILIESGVPLIDALQTSALLLSNQAFAHETHSATQAITRGTPLSQALAQHTHFLPMLHRMCAIAERTGSLSDTLAEIASFHEQLLTLTIKRLAAALEPITILFTGLLVGYVYIAFFLALFSIANAS